MASHKVTEEQFKQFQEETGSDFSEESPRFISFDIAEVKELIGEIPEGGALRVYPLVVNGKKTVGLRGFTGKEMTSTILEVGRPCPPFC